MSSDELVIVSNHLTTNRLQSYLNVTHGNDMSWLDELNQFIPPIRRLDIEQAKYFLIAEKRIVDHSNIVGQLNFGFWRSFLVRWNKDNLWPNALRFAFPHSPSRQPEYLFTRVRHLHILRNRIAHHEPIHQRDLAGDYQICLEVLSAISPVIAEWSAKNSRVLQVLAHRPH